jgi:membrane protease YdiL (CAAX protease family)
LTQDRITLFSDPEVVALWIVHDSMLLHEGSTRVPVGKVLSLLAGGVSLERIPEECEKVLRDTIAHLESTTTNLNAIMRLRANLAVLLAETDSLEDAAQVLVQLGGSEEAMRFIRAFHRVYRRNTISALLPEDHVAVESLVSGWGSWRFTERLSRATGNLADADWHGASIAREGADRMARWIFWCALVAVLQLAGLGSVAAWLILRRSFVPMPRWSCAAHEGFGLFVCAAFWGGVAEYTLIQAPVVGSLAWLSHCLVFGFPAVALLWFRHWRNGNASFRSFFGLPQHRAQLGQLLLATFATFGVSWLALSWIPYGFELAGVESDWAETVDEVILVWPWYAQFFHLLDGVVWGPCAEEILFRGLLFGALRARFSMWPAALFSALPFGLYHFYGLVGSISVTLFGVVCAIAREKTGSLLPCIAVHILTNFLILGGDVFVRF